MPSDQSGRAREEPTGQPNEGGAITRYGSTTRIQKRFQEKRIEKYPDDQITDDDVRLLQDSLEQDPDGLDSFLRQYSNSSLGSGEKTNGARTDVANAYINTEMTDGQLLQDEMTSGLTTEKGESIDVSYRNYLRHNYAQFLRRHLYAKNQVSMEHPLHMIGQRLYADFRNEFAGLVKKLCSQSNTDRIHELPPHTCWNLLPDTFEDFATRLRKARTQTEEGNEMVLVAEPSVTAAKGESKKRRPSALREEAPQSHRETRSQKREREAKAVYEALFNQVHDHLAVAAGEVVANIRDDDDPETIPPTSQRLLSNIKSCLLDADVGPFFMAVSLLVWQSKIKYEDLPESAADIIRPVQELLKQEEYEPCTRTDFSCNKTSCLEQWNAMYQAGANPNLQAVPGMPRLPEDWLPLRRSFNLQVISRYGLSGSLCTLGYSGLAGTNAGTREPRLLGARASLPNKVGPNRMLRSQNRQMVKRRRLQSLLEHAPASTRMEVNHDDDEKRQLRQTVAELQSEKQAWEVAKKNIGRDMMKERDAFWNEKQMWERDSAEHQRQVDQQGHMVAALERERDEAQKAAQNLQNQLAERNESLARQMEVLEAERNELRESEKSLQARLAGLWEENHQQVLALVQHDERALQLIHRNALDASDGRLKDQNDMASMEQRLTDMNTHDEYMAVLESIALGYMTIRLKHEHSQEQHVEALKGSIASKRHGEFITLYQELNLQLPSLQDLVQQLQRELDEIKQSASALAVTQNGDEQMVMVNSSVSCIIEKASSDLQALQAEHNQLLLRHSSLEMSVQKIGEAEAADALDRESKLRERWVRVSRVISAVMDLDRLHLDQHRLEVQEKNRKLDFFLLMVYDALQDGDIADESVVRRLHKILCACSELTVTGENIILGPRCAIRPALPKILSQTSLQSEACYFMLSTILDLIQRREELSNKSKQDVSAAQDQVSSLQKELADMSCTLSALSDQHGMMEELLNIFEPLLKVMGGDTVKDDAESQEEQAWSRGMSYLRAHMSQDGVYAISRAGNLCQRMVTDLGRILDQDFQSKARTAEAQRVQAQCQKSALAHRRMVRDFASLIAEPLQEQQTLCKKRPDRAHKLEQVRLWLAQADTADAGMLTRPPEIYSDDEPGAFLDVGQVLTLLANLQETSEDDGQGHDSEMDQQLMLLDKSQRDGILDLINLILRSLLTGKTLNEQTRLPRPLRSGEWADPRIMRCCHTLFCSCDADLSMLTRDMYYVSQFSQCRESFRALLPHHIQDKISDDYAPLFDILRTLEEATPIRSNMFEASSHWKSKLLNLEPYPVLESESQRHHQVPSPGRTERPKDLESLIQQLQARLQVQERDLARHKSELEARAQCNAFIRELHQDFHNTYHISSTTATTTTTWTESSTQPITKQRIEELLHFMTCYRLSALLYLTRDDKNEASERRARNCAELAGVGHSRFDQFIQMAEQERRDDGIPSDQNPTIRLCENLMGQILISVKKEQDMGRRAVEKLSSEREDVARELQRINTETLEHHHDVSWSIRPLDSNASSSLVQRVQRTMRNREQMMRSVCQNQEAHRVHTMLLLLELVNTDKVCNESAGRRLNAMIRHAQEGNLVCSDFVRMLVQENISVPACIEMVADEGAFWPAYRGLTRRILTQLDVWSWCERAYETIMTCSPARFPALSNRNYKHEPQDKSLCIRYKASRYRMTGLRAWPNGGFSVYLENPDTKMLQVALSLVITAGNAKQAESNADYIFKTCAAAFDSEDEYFMFDKGGNAATGIGIIHRLPLSITCVVGFAPKIPPGPAAADKKALVRNEDKADNTTPSAGRPVLTMTRKTTSSDDLAKSKHEVSPASEHRLPASGPQVPWSKVRKIWRGLGAAETAVAERLGNKEV